MLTGQIKEQRMKKQAWARGGEKWNLIQRNRIKINIFPQLPLIEEKEHLKNV